jgi:hypothetical protein
VTTAAPTLLSLGWRITRLFSSSDLKKRVGFEI